MSCILVRRIHQYKMQRILLLPFFTPKDGATIEVKPCHGQPPSRPQPSALPQAELKYRTAGSQTGHGDKRR